MESTINEAPPSTTNLAKQIGQGRAMFSTNFGQYPAREATRPGQAPIIMRSDLSQDIDSMISRLRRDFPTTCKAITAPISNLYEYFDHYDVQSHGTSVINTVLNTIASQNSSRLRCIEEFVNEWKKTHLDLFHAITSDTQEVFAEEDEEAYGEDFLKDALAQIKQLKLLTTPAQLGALSGHPSSITGSTELLKKSESGSLKPRPVDYKSTVSAQQNTSLPLSIRTTSINQKKGRGSAVLASSGDPALPQLPTNHDISETAPLSSLKVQENRPRDNQIRIHPSQSAVDVEPIQHGPPRQAGFGYHPYAAPFIPRNVPAILPLPAHSLPGISSKEYQFAQLPSFPPPPQMESTGNQFSNISAGPSRAPLGPHDLNVRAAHFYPGMVGSYSYHPADPPQPPMQGFPWDAPRLHSGLALPDPRTLQGGHVPSVGYQNYQYQDPQGFMPVVPGLTISQGLPGPNEEQRFAPIYLPKSREVQKHRLFQTRAPQNRTNLRAEYPSQVTGTGQLQDRGKQPGPHMPFSNDARVNEYRETNRRYPSWDESSGTRVHQEVPQQLYRNGRRQSKGVGSRRPSVPHHSPNEPDEIYYSHGIFSPASFYKRSRSSGDYTGYIMDKIDENQSVDNLTADNVVPAATSSSKSPSDNIVIDHPKASQSQTAITKADVTNFDHDRLRGQILGTQPGTNQMSPSIIYLNQSNQLPLAENSWFQTVPPVDPRKLFVCGDEITRDDLVRLFSPFGPILFIAEPRMSGRKDSATPITSRRYSFIMFKFLDDAARAQQQLHGLPSRDGDCVLTVHVSQPKTSSRYQGIPSAMPLDLRPLQSANNISPKNKCVSSQLGEPQTARVFPSSDNLTNQGRAKKQNSQKEIQHEQRDIAKEPRTPDRTDKKPSENLWSGKDHTTPKRVKSAIKAENNSSHSSKKSTPTHKKGRSVAGHFSSPKKKRLGLDKSTSRDHLSHGGETGQNNNEANRNVVDKGKRKVSGTPPKEQNNSINNCKDDILYSTSKVVSSDPVAPKNVTKYPALSGERSKLELNNNSTVQQAFISDGSPSKKSRKQGAHVKPSYSSVGTVSPRGDESYKHCDKDTLQSLDYETLSLSTGSRESATRTKSMVVGQTPHSPLAAPDFSAEKSKKSDPDSLSYIEASKALNPSETTQPGQSIQPTNHTDGISSKSQDQESATSSTGVSPQQQPKQSYSAAAKTAIAKSSDPSRPCEPTMPSQAADKKTEVTARSLNTSKPSDPHFVPSSKPGEKGKDKAERSTIIPKPPSTSATNKRPIVRRKELREKTAIPLELSGRHEKRIPQNIQPPDTASIVNETTVFQMPTALTKLLELPQEELKTPAIKFPLPSSPPPAASSLDLPRSPPSSAEKSKFPNIPARTSSSPVSAPISTHMKKQKMRPAISEALNLNSELNQENVVVATSLSERGESSNVGIPASPEARSEQSSRKFSVPTADDPKVEETSRELKSLISHDSNVEEPSQGSKLTEADNRVALSSSQNRNYPAADKDNAVYSSALTHIPSSSSHPAEMPSSLEVEPILPSSTAHADPAAPRKKKKKNKSKKKKGKQTETSVTEDRTPPATSVPLDIEDVLTSIVTHDGPLRFNLEKLDQPPLGFIEDISPKVSEGTVRAESEKGKSVNPNIATGDPIQIPAQTREQALEVFKAEIVNFLGGIGLPAIENEQFRSGDSSETLRETSASKDSGENFADGFKNEDFAAYFSQKAALYTPILQGAIPTLPKAEDRFAETPLKTGEMDQPPVYTGRDSSEGKTARAAEDEQLCPKVSIESSSKPEVSTGFGELTAKHSSPKDAHFLAKLKSNIIRLSEADAKPTQATSANDEMNRPLVHTGTDSDEGKSVKATKDSQPRRDSPRSVPETVSSLDFKDDVTTYLSQKATSHLPVLETTTFKASKTAIEDVEANSLTEAEERLHVQKLKDPHKNVDEESTSDEHSMLAGGLAPESEIPLDLGLVSNVDSSEVIATELSEAGIIHHHATVAIDKTEEAVIQERRNSSSTSDHSVTSSKQRKLFSEVMGSPGNSRLNVIDLSVDNGGKASPSSSRRKKAGRTEKQERSDDDNAWKVPTGEKMWGSEEKR